MNATTVPRRLDDITPEWLSSVLGADVSKVDIRTVLGGTATKVVLDVTYGTPAGLPASMCLKAGMGDHSEQLAQVGIYEAEARFYRDERPHSKVRAPIVFWADWDAERYGAILMEDLARPTVQFANSLAPLTPSDAASGLGNLALLHASRWNSAFLKSAEWLDCLGDPGSRAAEYFTSMSPDAIDDYLHKPRRAAVVPSQLRDARTILDAFRAYVAVSTEGPQTLVHGDAHIGNSYVEHGEVAFADWQTVRRESPAFDVAYFLGSALTTEDRRTHERELIAGYLDELARSGIPSPPTFAEMWRLYRIHMIYGYLAWLTNREEFQPEDFTAVTLERFGAAVVDLDTARLLAATV